MNEPFGWTIKFSFVFMLFYINDGKGSDNFIDGVYITYKYWLYLRTWQIHNVPLRSHL